MTGSKLLTILVLLLGSALAAPVQAQPFSAFGLQFGWGDSYESPGPERAMCMTDRQIREAIAERGYSDIALNAPNDRLIQVRAVKGGITYLLRFDFCNDTIEDRQALRRN